MNDSIIIIDAYLNNIAKEYNLNETMSTAW